jgi:hypothetical protein
MVPGMDVTTWLLDADPSIRWQVLRDLLDAPPEEVAAERSRVAKEGWGARFLDLEDPDGQWAGGALFPHGEWDRSEPGQPWTATYPVLLVLRQIGVDPADERVRASIAKVAANCVWENDGQAFFDGEIEPCINGTVVGLGAYFGRDVEVVVARLLDDQLSDGGWNCEAENGATVSSVHSTIGVLEGLLLHERATGGTPAATAARERGEEYLLERRLYRRRSTGEPMDPAFGLFSFPTRWHYDVLRALDHFRAVGGAPDPRLAEGIEMVRSRRRSDGTWPLENTHIGRTSFDMEDGDGAPSRWNTLRASRVLRWWDTAAG